MTITSVDVIANVEQLSVAVADPLVAGSVLAVHDIVRLAGHEMTGATISWAVMV